MVGIVNGEPDWRGHGKVVNGCSDVLVEVLGDRGRHARTCTGSGSLPAAVTCEMVVRIRPEGPVAGDLKGAKQAGEVEQFLASPSVSKASGVFAGLFQEDRCWSDICGVTYGVLNRSFAHEQLFDFNEPWVLRNE